MKYVVFTTKHHDGFCLFDTKLTGYNSMKTPARCDFVKEYVGACRCEGLRVGLYYSVEDWHHPDWPMEKSHPLYPVEKRKGEPREPVYFRYMLGQIRELLTNYGQIDVLWFDRPYKGVDGDALERTIRKIQPDIIINNRFDAGRKKGDFLTPEQWIPEEQMTVDGKPALWEACHTMTGRSWGYDRYDKDYRSSEELIKMLDDVAGKGGNMLLNIGPRMDGSVPKEVAANLRKIGRGMRQNKKSVVAVKKSRKEKKANPGPSADLPVDYYVRPGRPVPVTGDTDPAVWGRIKPVRVTQKTHWDAAAQRYPQASRAGWCAYNFRLMYAENVLYVAVEVESSHPISRRNIWCGDSAEIFFGADIASGKQDCFQIVVDVDGRILVPGEETMPGLIFRHGARRTHSGYNVVLAVPFAALSKVLLKTKSGRISEGHVFRFNIIVNQATPTKWDTDPDSWEKQDHKPWWERDPRPPDIFIAERHRVHWKGRSMDEDPVKNLSIWGRMQIGGMDIAAK